MKVRKAKKATRKPEKRAAAKRTTAVKRSSKGKPRPIA